MKKLLVLIALIFVSKYLSAQHYVGVTFTPYIMLDPLSEKHDGLFPGVDAENKSYFGYSVGYQGILMPKRRFTFSYGFQYSDFYYEYTLDPSQSISFNDSPNPETLSRRRQDFEALQIPLWWQYNILKDKEKWQPYFAISTTVTIPLKDYYTYFTLESPPREVDAGFGLGISFDLGLGVNYYTNRWCFSPQVTYSPSYMSRLGLSLTVLRKF
jgi:hypothetical protein